MIKGNRTLHHRRHLGLLVDDPPQWVGSPNPDAHEAETPERGTRAGVW